MARTLIEFKDFSCALDKITVLDALKLQIYEGEYLSIIGPNGAGKTTLLRCVLGILRPTGGELLVQGRPAFRQSRRQMARLMSYVPQHGVQSLPFTVEEFVMMARYPHLGAFASPREEDRNAVRRALAVTGFQDWGERDMDTLSGGERQAVFIASALAQGARVLLLDEATASLDPRHDSDILRLLKKINREEGVTIVSVTHDLNKAAMYSDRIAILKRGRLHFVGEPREVMLNEVLERVYEMKFTFVRHPKTQGSVIVPEAM